MTTHIVSKPQLAQDIQPTLHLRSAGVYRRKLAMVMPQSGRGVWEAPVVFGIIEHPVHGLGLFDTGYGQGFVSATRRYPERLMRHRMPTRSMREGVVHHLDELGFGPEDVRWVVMSQFRAKHIGALDAMVNARFIYDQRAYDNVRQARGWLALSRGFLPELLPSNFEARSRAVCSRDWVCATGALEPFVSQYDIFGDGTLIAVPLPGATVGQMGLLVRAQADVLLAADAAFTTRAYQEHIMPHGVATSTFGQIYDYQRTMARLRDFAERAPQCLIVPTHCQQAMTHAQGVLAQAQVDVIAA